MKGLDSGQGEPADTVAEKFHLKEYELVKAEVFKLIERADNLLYVTVAGVFAYFAWILTNRTAVVSNWAMATKLPTVVVLVAIASGIAIFLRVNIAASYLEQIEDAYGQKDLGWEKHLKKTKISFVLPISGQIVCVSSQILVAAAAWVIIFVSCVAAAVLLK